MPTANTVAVRVAIDNAQATIKALRDTGVEGEAAFQKIVGGATRASDALQSIPGAANQNIQGFRRFGEVARQAGFQIGDFAVQVQSGTSVVVAAGQQLGQLAGSFGVVGAAIGGAISVGAALITYFQRQGEVTEKTTDEMADFGDALTSTGQRITSYIDLLNQASGETEKLLNKIAEIQKRKAEEAGATAIEELSGLAEARAVIEGSQRLLLEADQRRATVEGQAGGFDPAAELARLDEVSRKAEEYGENAKRLLDEAFKSRDPQAIAGIINNLRLVGEVAGVSAEEVQKLIDVILTMQGEAGAIGAVQDIARRNAAILAQAAQRTPPGERVTRQQILPQSSSFREAEQESAEKLGEFERDQIAKTVAAREAAGRKAATAAKAETDRLEALAQRQREYTAALDEKLAASERELEAVNDGAYAVKLANIEHTKQNEILKARKQFLNDEIKLKEQIAKIEQIAANERRTASIATPVPTPTPAEEQDPASLKVRAERESAEQVADYKRDLDKKNAAEAKQDAEAEAKRRADILAQPYKDLASEINQILADSIQSALEGDFDMKSLADSFGEAMSTAISGAIAATLTETLTQAALDFSKAASKALAEAFAQETARQQATGAAQGSQLVTVSPAGAQPKPGAPGAPPAAGGVGGTGMGYGGYAVAGAAGGYLAGSIYGQAAGKEDTYAGAGGAVGGAIGTAAGAAIGTFLIPGLGTVGGAAIGGLIGAGLGAVAGGMFGGQGLGNDRSAQAYRSGRGIIYSDVSFSAENREITQGILDQVVQLEEAFIGLGGVVDTVKLRVEAGNKSGITVNGKKYDNAQDALAAALEELIGETTGLSPTAQRILETTKAKDVQGIAEDLAFGERYDQLTFQGDEFARALQDLDKAFAQDSRRATELGLDVTALAAARDREIALIEEQRSQQQRGLYEQLAAVSGDQSLGTQLHILETQMRDLAAAAANANIPLEAVTAAHQAAAQAIIAAADQSRRSIYEQIAAVSGDTSLGTQLHILDTQMRELAAAAANLNVPLEAVTAAHQAAAQAIIAAAAEIARQTDQSRRSIYEQIATASGDTSLGTQLHILETQMRELAAAAEKAGIPLSYVTKAHQEAAKRIIEAAAAIAQQTDQSIRGFFEQLAGLSGDQSLGTQLHILETQMRDLAAAAKELGIPLSTVTKAHQAAAVQIVAAYDQTRRGVAEQIAAARGDQSLATQLHVLETQMRELAKAAADVGIPLSEVTKAHEAARVALRRQFEQQQRGVTEQLAAARGDNSLGAQLYVLDTQMRDLAAAAANANIPLSEVTKAHEAAAKRIREADRELRRAFQQEVALLDATDLERELAGIGDRFRELIKQSIELGYATDGLRASQVKAEAAAIEATRKQLRNTEQSLAGAQREVFGQIDQFLDPIKQALGPSGIGQGVYSGAAQSESSIAEFRKQLELAREGDVAALQSLVGAGQGAIQAARAFGASGSEFATVFKEVNQALLETRGTLEEKRMQLIQQGLDYQKLTLDEQIRTRVESVAAIKELIAELKRSLSLSAVRRAA